MKRSISIKFPLRPLAWIAGCSLLCIIGLQLYWLITLYTQQKDHFTADVQNALTITEVQFHLTNSFSGMEINGGDPITNNLTEILTAAMSKIPGNAMDKGHIKNITISVDSSCDNPSPERRNQIINSNILRNKAVLSKLQVTPSPKLSNYTPLEKLLKYKVLLKDELAKRSIRLPFELAMFNRSGYFLESTCDSAIYKRISVRSTAEIVQLPKTEVIQAAFPNANMYLLKRMTWLLLITFILIIIGAISFSYLVLLFFRQKRLSDMKNDFLNNMTHELKTPISSVSVALELINDSKYPVSKSVKDEYFGIAQSELKRLTMLVEKVLRIAAFENGEIKIHTESFSVSPWLQDTLLSLKPLIESTGTILTSTIEPETLSMHADKAHMTNVLQNLLENAIKYNEKKEPSVCVNISVLEGYLNIKVEDNGIGIPPVYIDKVFDNFFRVPFGDRHDIKGYGLGLSYVKAIVELHGGLVSVTSKGKEGSKFIIQLPI